MRYKPAVIFADGEWEHPAETWRSTELLAWLYNQGPNPDEVVVNDRWGKDLRSFCGDYYTTEYGLYANKEMSGSHPWEESRGIGHSYGYNRNENVDDYMSRTKCVRTLIDMVSRGGNLLLDIGPTGDGRIPVIMQDRLLAIGRWLKVNSESIYGTTAGPFQDLAWGRSTAKGNKIYLHIYEWPAGGKLDVPPLENRVVSSYLLADPDRSTVPISGGEGGGWQLDLSGRCPQKHATVVVLTLDGPPKAPKKTEAAAGDEDEQR
jgi:hypothetical protein